MNPDLIIAAVVLIFLLTITAHVLTRRSAPRKKKRSMSMAPLPPRIERQAGTHDDADEADDDVLAAYEGDDAALLTMTPPAEPASHHHVHHVHHEHVAPPLHEPHSPPSHDHGSYSPPSHDHGSSYGGDSYGGHHDGGSFGGHDSSGGGFDGGGFDGGGGGHGH